MIPRETETEHALHMMTVMGEKYTAARICADDISFGTLVRFSAGSALRRIVGRDGDEIILRGVHSTNVFEAVTPESLLDDWYRLVPLAQAKGADAAGRDSE